jgi:4-amino-4-deoxychorismate lyase
MTSRVTIPVLINGEPLDCLSSLDRGLLYGDGVFETLTVLGGQPQFWRRHMTRLRAGCKRLGIPFRDESCLLEEACKITVGSDPCVLKVIVTRGPGGRGYQAPVASKPARIIQRHPYPDGVPACRVDGEAVRLCEQRLGWNPALAGIKHLNRLEQVLARQEWDDPDIREGLLCDRDGRLIEGTMSNLFVIKGQTLATPDLTRCGVAGIMRTVVMELADQVPVQARIKTLTLPDLEQADEVFLTNSVIGIWPVIEVDKQSCGKGPITRRLQDLLANLQSGGDAWQQ